MKKPFALASAAAGLALLVCASPAMAHDRVGVSLSFGLPVAPLAVYAPPAPVYYPPQVYYAPPAPVYYPPAAQVVIGGYGPVAPYYYARYHHHFRHGGHRDWR